MKITKNTKFEEIEKLYINYYDIRKGEIYYPPNLKELYINILKCNSENLKNLNLPYSLEKLYIHYVEYQNNNITDCSIDIENSELKNIFKIPFGCNILSLNIYDNPYEDLKFIDFKFNENKIITYDIHDKKYIIKKLLKIEKGFYIPFYIPYYNNVKKYKDINLNLII